MFTQQHKIVTNLYTVHCYQFINAVKCFMTGLGSLSRPIMKHFTVLMNSCLYLLVCSKAYSPLLFLSGAGVTVDDSVDYTVREDNGSVNIIILLDQPSCQTITVIANPQVRSPPSATGNTIHSIQKSLYVSLFQLMILTLLK